MLNTPMTKIGEEVKVKKTKLKSFIDIHNPKHAGLTISNPKQISTTNRNFKNVFYILHQKSFKSDPMKFD